MCTKKFKAKSCLSVSLHHVVVDMVAGQSVVCEVMRRILAARAIHNLFSTTELKLTITSTHLVLIDPSTGAARLQHSLKDIAYWAAHSENHK